MKNLKLNIIRKYLRPYKKEFLYGSFALLIVNAIVMYFHTYLSGWLGQNIIKDIRIKLFSHLQKFKLQFFDKN